MGNPIASGHGFDHRSRWVAAPSPCSGSVYTGGGSSGGISYGGSGIGDGGHSSGASNGSSGGSPFGIRGSSGGSFGGLGVWAYKIMVSLHDGGTSGGRPTSVRFSFASGWCRYAPSRFKKASRTRDFIEPSRTPRVDASSTGLGACGRLETRLVAFFASARGLGALRFAAIPLPPHQALRRRSVQPSDGAVETARATWCPRERGTSPSRDTRSRTPSKGRQIVNKKNVKRLDQ